MNMKVFRSFSSSFRHGCMIFYVTAAVLQGASGAVTALSGSEVPE